MSRYSPASLGCGAFLAYVVFVLIAIVAGYWVAWDFTAYTAVPWMEVPGEWSKLTSVLLTIFITGPFCVSIAILIEAVVAMCGLGLLGLIFSRR